MKKFFTAQICENGHIASSYGDSTDLFCRKCGAPIISKCPACKQPIKGKPNEDYSYMYSYERPSFCVYCGSPFPWVIQAQEAAQELLALDATLDPEEQKLLYNSIPDLVVDTPKSKVAATRWSRFLSHVKPQFQDAIKQVLIEVVSEGAKKVLFGS